MSGLVLLMHLKPKTMRGQTPQFSIIPIGLQLNLTVLPRISVFL